MVDYNFAKSRLLEKYSADENGTWTIYGEDPNCDFGGSHHEPELETVSGRYIDVVEYALTLKGFFVWGYGGIIKRAKNATKNIPKGFTTESLKDLYAKRDALQKELIAIEEKIRILDIDWE